MSATEQSLQTVRDFNEILLNLAINISSICPTSVIGANIKEIEKAIKNKNNFNKFIDLFTIKVLQYKPEIDAGDETFFLSKDYTGDIDGNSSLDIVSSLKTVWTQLKKTNKDIVMMNMRILCELSQQHFEHVQSLIPSN